MIVKIFDSGKSFKGLSAYLTHDPDAETADRVAWTHTHNLANDHVPSAVDEMLWTARDAELLKQEAGIRAGGRATENPAKHVSLNWSPKDSPTREHMIETSESFLQKMGWQDHQAIFIAHSDKEHAHVHLLISAVHPETGLKLDEGFEYRRAQAWALQYEREQGRIDCEQRLKDPRERQDAPTRDAWTAFQENQKEFERTEKSRRDEAEKATRNHGDAGNRMGTDWKILKDFQRDERLSFFAEGKLKFDEIRAEVFQGVREDFRDRWSEYYAAKRDGSDPERLAETKAALLAEQKAALAQRRDDACQELRSRRDTAYRDLLDHQNDTRLIFRERVKAGLDNSAFFQELRENLAPAAEAAPSFREAANQATGRTESEAPRAHAPTHDVQEGERAEERSNAGSGGIGSLGFGLLTIGESLFATFIAAQPSPRARNQGERHPFEAASEEAAKRLHRERQDADEAWRERQRTACRD